MRDGDRIRKLLTEMAFVGVSLALLGLPVSYAMDALRGRKIDVWPKHVWGMLVGTAATGAAFHFICEYVGLNEWYVRQYTPLLPRRGGGSGPRFR